MSDKCSQNVVQVVGQMSVSDKCPCRTNVRVGQMSVSENVRLPSRNIEYAGHWTVVYIVI